MKMPRMMLKRARVYMAHSKINLSKEDIRRKAIPSEITPSVDDMRHLA